MASRPISKRVIVIGGDIDRSLVGRVVSGEHELVSCEPVLTGSGAYLSALVGGGRTSAVFVREDANASGTWFMMSRGKGIPIYLFNDTNVYRWQRREG